MQKTSAPITATITTLSHEGRGLTHLNGKPTFVSGALAGETVNLVITRKSRRHQDARVVDVLTAAPERIIPVCPHADICGGCSLQHMDPAAQVRFKEDSVRQQLHRFGRVTPAVWLPPLTGATVGYRRKARLGVRYVIKKEKLLVGFREKASNYLADIQECHTLDARVGMHLTDINAVIQQLSCYKEIAQVEVAASDTEVALVFRHLVPLTETDRTVLCEFGARLNFQIWLQPNLPATIEKLFPADNNAFLHYSLPEWQLDLRFHPLDFTQVNHGINPRMIAAALHLLDIQTTDHVLDLFCGLGNFTLPMARVSQHVTGIEGSTEMVQRASDNAAYNNIANTEFTAANLAAPDENAPWLNRDYERLLLDPSRTGAAEILACLGKLWQTQRVARPARIVYVSCNPATLARDAGALVHEHGYQLHTAGIIDMFPHTAHIESIALFTLG
jgi:23S rRNA (uracil1939-C5)-methyltransferase